MLSHDMIKLMRRISAMCREEIGARALAAEADDQRDPDERDEQAFLLAAGFLSADAEGSALGPDEREDVAAAVVDDLYYLGPLEDLLHDDDVTEIMVNSPRDVYIERNGRLERTEVTFEDDRHVKAVIDRIAGNANRRCDEGEPLCDCVLVRPGEAFDGSRVNAVCKGIAVDHNLLDIRKFRTDAVSPEFLRRTGSLDQRICEILEALVRGRMNIVISGGTGSGKTTLLNAMSSFIPDAQRIVTIEDTAELRLQKPHWVRMQSRPANTEGSGEITIEQLVKNALRQRPDRIVVGECRGAEAFQMIQAMSTGHAGSLTTVHANNSRDALNRLRSMIQMADIHMDAPDILELVARAIDFVVQIERFPDGSRRVVEISEVQGMQGDVVTMAPIIAFHQDPWYGGEVTGAFAPTGERFDEDHARRLASNGVEVDDWWFSE